MNPAESDSPSRDGAVEEMRREADRLEKAVVKGSMTEDAECLWMGRPRLERVGELRAEADRLREVGNF